MHGSLSGALSQDLLALVLDGAALSELVAAGAVLSEGEHVVLGIGSHGVLLLDTKLWAPCVRDELENVACNPGGEASTNRDGPVLTSETVRADLKCEAAELNDDDLGTRNTKKNEDEHPVLRDSFENILLIVDLTSVDKVENLHDCEHIENICHVTTCSVLLLID